MNTNLVPTPEELEAIRRERCRKAAELLRKWAQEDSAYDDEVSALLEEALKDSGLRCGEPDEPAA